MTTRATLRFFGRCARLPHVKHVASVTAPSAQVLGPNGAPANDPAHRLFDSTVNILADVDGGLTQQDRLIVIQGRLFDPRRADEMVLSADAAAILHLHVGDVVPFGFYTNLQTTQSGYGTGRQKPVRRVNVKLVGIVTLHFQVVRDDFDRALKLGLFSPALTRPLNKCCANGVISGVQLDRGSRDDAAVEAEIKQSLPSSTVLNITSVVEATAERAIEPQVDCARRVRRDRGPGGPAHRRGRQSVGNFAPVPPISTPCARWVRAQSRRWPTD